MKRMFPNPQPARSIRRRMVHSSLPWLAVLLVLAGAAAMRAEHTRYWRQSSFDEFERGTAKSVALRSDGKLLLAPRFTPVADVNLAFLWALRADSNGNLFAAGGSSAKVVKIDSAGKMTTEFESSELSAQALATDAQDNLYVGTSPDGKVYKISPGGEKKDILRPEDKVHLGHRGGFGWNGVCGDRRFRLDICREPGWKGRRFLQERSDAYPRAGL